MLFLSHVLSVGFIFVLYRTRTSFSLNHYVACSEGLLLVLQVSVTMWSFDTVAMAAVGIHQRKRVPRYWPLSWSHFRVAWMRQKLSLIINRFVCLWVLVLNSEEVEVSCNRIVHYTMFWGLFSSLESYCTCFAQKVMEMSYYLCLSSTWVVKLST